MSILPPLPKSVPSPPLTTISRRSTCKRNKQMQKKKSSQTTIYKFLLINIKYFFNFQRLLRMTIEILYIYLFVINCFISTFKDIAFRNTRNVRAFNRTQYISLLYNIETHTIVVIAANKILHKKWYRIVDF